MTTQPTPMHFPIDDCAKCTVRGDMGGCLATRCSLHESWYARTQNARITELESQLAQRFDAADMATAAAQGFRDGAASVDVAQERQTPEHIEAMQRAWLWMENQAEAQSKGGHATFDLMMLRDERDALRAAIDSCPPPALEGWKPTSEMRAVVAVAVTMLYDTHPEDVLRVFDLCELEKISIITMLLGSQQVEDIYRSAWDHLTAAPGPADGESNV